MTVILVAEDELFRQHLYQRLLQADCKDVRVAEPPTEFAPLLCECKDALVILGGRWSKARALLCMAVRTRARAILVLQQPVVFEPKAAREALEIGARAVLHSEISNSAFKAAVAASDAGLIVLDRALNAHRESPNPHQNPDEWSRGTRRQLTIRERNILSLVAGGISNKGVARTVGISINTVKYHLSSIFEKLSATTRAEAVAEAIRRGELSLSASSCSDRERRFYT